MKTGQAAKPFGDLLRDLHGGVIWRATSPALDLSFVSDSAVELLGYPAQQWQSERGFLKKHSHQEDWARMIEAVFDATVEGGVQSLQHRMFSADGSTVWAKTSICSTGPSDGGFSLEGLTVDITDVKNAELAYRDAEVHSRLLVENIRDYAVFMVSPEGKVTSWNVGARRLKGYAAEEVIGEPIDRFFPEEELRKDTPHRMLTQAEAAGQAEYEGFLVHKSGNQFWASLSASQVEDRTGAGRGFSIVVRDMTQRKQNEEALRESERVNRVLIDSFTDHCFMMLSPQGSITRWSPGAERLKGYRAEEIIGQPFSRFFPPEHLERGTPAELMQRAAVEGQAEYEGWVVRKGGVRRWELMTLSAVRQGESELHGFSIVSRDMTERMQAERAQAFLSDVGTLLACSLDYRVTLDRVAHLVTRTMAHWCLVELTGVNALVVAHVDAEKERRLKKALTTGVCQTRLRESVASVLQIAEPELGPDGAAAGSLIQELGIEDPAITAELATQSYLCVPLAARGKMLGAMVCLSPPGKRYTREDLLLAQELGRRVALGVDHAQLYEQAQAAIHVRDQVLAVVSHDLLNPVTTIQLLASQLSAQIHDGENATRVARASERIHRATDRMVLMIRDLLDYSNIEAGKLRIVATSQDVTQMVVEALELLQPIASAHGTSIAQDLDPRRVNVRCDRERTLQVLSNLIGNAVKFSGAGATVTIRTQVERENVVVSVADTGPGISEVDLPHIFDRYWQAQHNLRSSLGLGLAISKSIVEAQGGAIWARSKVGEGTTLFFTLPMG